MPLRAIKAFCYGAPKICPDLWGGAKKQPVPLHVGLARWAPVIMYVFSGVSTYILRVYSTWVTVTQACNSTKYAIIENKRDIIKMQVRSLKAYHGRFLWPSYYDVTLFFLLSHQRENLLPCLSFTPKTYLCTFYNWVLHIVLHIIYGSIISVANLVRKKLKKS